MDVIELSRNFGSFSSNQCGEIIFLTNQHPAGHLSKMCTDHYKLPWCSELWLREILSHITITTRILLMWGFLAQNDLPGCLATSSKISQENTGSHHLLYFTFGKSLELAVCPWVTTTVVPWTPPPATTLQGQEIVSSAPGGGMDKLARHGPAHLALLNLTSQNQPCVMTVSQGKFISK